MYTVELENFVLFIVLNKDYSKTVTVFHVCPGRMGLKTLVCILHKTYDSEATKLLPHKISCSVLLGMELSLGLLLFGKYHYAKMSLFAYSVKNVR